MCACIEKYFLHRNSFIYKSLDAFHCSEPTKPFFCRIVHCSQQEIWSPLTMGCKTNQKGSKNNLDMQLITSHLGNWRLILKLVKLPLFFFFFRNMLILMLTQKISFVFSVFVSFHNLHHLYILQTAGKTSSALKISAATVLTFKSRPVCVPSNLLCLPAKQQPNRYSSAATFSKTAIPSAFIFSHSR